MIGCSMSSDSQLALDAIQKTKSNKIELQNVLNSYCNNPDKLKAAEFLIANMNHKYTVAIGNESQYIDVLDSISQLDDPIGGTRICLLRQNT